MSNPPLSAFGQRIMVCGPSSNGKSTLAAAIGARLDLPVVHLDLLRHQPHTDWQQRPDAEFARLHEEAIARERWVMDGNYSKLMPARLTRATGIVLLGANRWSNLLRYFRRALSGSYRIGALEGAHEQVKWSMIHWILVASPPHLAVSPGATKRWSSLRRGANDRRPPRAVPGLGSPAAGGLTRFLASRIAQSSWPGLPRPPNRA